MSGSPSNLAADLIDRGLGEGLTVRDDGMTSVVLDADQQGCVNVGGARTHAMWACQVCAIPTGGSKRTCQTHPDAGVFLKHIMERSHG